MYFLFCMLLGGMGFSQDHGSGSHVEIFMSPWVMPWSFLFHDRCVYLARVASLANLGIPSLPFSWAKRCNGGRLPLTTITDVTLVPWPYGIHRMSSRRPLRAFINNVMTEEKVRLHMAIAWTPKTTWGYLYHHRSLVVAADIDKGQTATP